MVLLRAAVVFVFGLFPLFLLTPFSAASEDRNAYVEVSGGASFFDSISSKGLAEQSKSIFDAGFNAGLALGYRTSLFRLEAAGDYRQAEVSKFEALGASASDGNGNAGLLTLMANLYFDIPLGLPVTPYVGGGVGLGVVIVDESDATSPVIIDDHGFAFAYNAMGGVSITLSEPLQVLVGYRFVGTSRVELSGVAEGIGQASNFKTEIQTHELMVGMRWNF